MSMFLLNTDEDNEENINIDDLYNKNQQRHLKELSIFNKLLNRIHTRIKHVSRTKTVEKFIWYNVPEFIFGEPCYNQGNCIGYLVVKLEKNGFLAKYIHPNTLFVSWESWIPSYIRNEIKKKTGKIIDEKGNLIEKKRDDDDGEVEQDINSTLFNDQNKDVNHKEKKIYTSINNYKPTGNIIYKGDMFDQIEKKINK
tara:strand:+ start:6031 stop:6621 length:591 start_codon:yes stop_codon:yes gene_type:complete